MIKQSNMMSGLDQEIALHCSSMMNSNIPSPTSENNATNVAASSNKPPPSCHVSRYESQKRRDWNTFGQYLDQFGKTKVHCPSCPFFGHPQPPAPCPCPLRQAWGSLDALVGRLRAAFEENGGTPELNPFGARAVRLYLREVRDTQARARGIAYDKKKRKNNKGINNMMNH